MRRYQKTAVSIILGLMSTAPLAAEKISAFDNLDKVNLNVPVASKLEVQRISSMSSDAEEEKATAGSELAERIHQAFGLSEKSNLKLIGVSNDDKSEYTYYTYQLIFEGLKLWGHDLVFAVDKYDNVVKGYGDLVKSIEADLPGVTILSEHYLQQKLSDFIQKNYSEKERVFRSKSVEQVVYLDENNVARNAIKLSFFTDLTQGRSNPEKILAFVDVESDELISLSDTLDRYKVGGSGPTGNVKVNKDRTKKYEATAHDHYPQTTFIVEKNGNTCSFNANNVKTRDYNSGTQKLADVFEYECNDDRNENTKREINGAYSPLNDAQYRAQITSKMFEAYLGVLPFGNRTIEQNVHYGQNLDQAFYEDGQLYYGDGVNNFYPMVALDVVAHEIAHGFTSEFWTGNPKLMTTGQARAVNEAFSDMAGEAAEYYLSGHLSAGQTFENDWMSNFESYKRSQTGALRYLDDPTKDGLSIGHVDDYYQGLDSHYGSGVFNKVFYNLATLDLEQNEISPWNTKYAFIAFGRANIDCWTSNATFVSAADCVMDTASTLKDIIRDDGIRKNNGSAWTTAELKNHIRKAFATVGISLRVDQGLQSDFDYEANFLNVTFSNLSRNDQNQLNQNSGSQWSWYWVFEKDENGNPTKTSNEFNPIHSFSQSGTYDVTLTVSNSNTGKSDTILIPVKLNSAYCEAWGANSEEYYADTVLFNGVGKNNTGYSSGYENFTSVDIKIPSGAQTNFELVTGYNSSSADDWKYIRVWIDKNLNGVFDRDSELEIQTSTKDRISQKIDFIGKTDERYRVRVVVTNDLSLDPPCGRYSFAEIEDYELVWSGDAPLYLNVDPVKDPLNENYYQFNNTTDDERVNHSQAWEWNFGDGNLSAVDSRNKSPVYGYKNKGTYKVTLKAYSRDNKVIGTWDQTIDFTPKTEAKFTPVKDGNKVTVDSTQSIYPRGSKVTWTFINDNGQQLHSVELDNPDHEFSYTFPNSNGEKTIRMNIVNPDNQSYSAEEKVNLASGSNEIQPNFEVDSVTQLASGEYKVKFKNTTQDPGDKHRDRWIFTWKFGDGSEEEVRSYNINEGVEHTYASSGNKTVTLNIEYKRNDNSWNNWGWFDKSTQKTIEVSFEPVEYCQAAGDSGAEYISKVIINGKEFSTDGSGGLVNEGNPLILYTGRDNSYRIEATYPDTDEKYTENYHVWVDLNGNGEFGNGQWQPDTTGERVLNRLDSIGSGNADGFISGDFRLPSGTNAISKTRLRILQFYAVSPTENLDPCADYSQSDDYGEIEDYEVEIRSN